MSVEAKIKQAICEKGLRFNYVAEKAGINYVWLNKSLNGKRRMTANELIGLCVVLNLDIDDFTDSSTSTNSAEAS